MGRKGGKMARRGGGDGEKGKGRMRRETIWGGKKGGGGLKLQGEEREVKKQG